MFTMFGRGGVVMCLLLQSFLMLFSNGTIMSMQYKSWCKREQS